MSLRMKLEAFYSDLSYESLDAIADIYHESVTFTDPVSTFSGLPSLTSYFEKLLVSTESCLFDIKTVDQCADHIYVVWTMIVRHPRINKGQTYTVDGVSIIKVKDERIIYQRDFYDMGELMYERLPILKQLILFVKKKIES